MKIIVLHGEDTTKSYERLKTFINVAKKRNWEILYDDISSTPSLFGKERLTVVRDYKLLQKKTVDGTLVIYHEAILPITFLKSLPKDTRIEEFKLPKLIWSFLEYLYPGNSEGCIIELHEIIEREPVEFVFSLICKQFKEMYWILMDTKSVQFPAWKASKLRSQASKFSLDRIKQIIRLLSEIDYSVKTGKSDLTNELDLLIIKQLE